VLAKGGHVARDERRVCRVEGRLVAAETDHERGVVARGKEPPGAGDDRGDRVAPLQTVDRPPKGSRRGLTVGESLADEVRNHLGVGVAAELVTRGLEVGPE
jgi:hypothetical protein